MFNRRPSNGTTITLSLKVDHRSDPDPLESPSCKAADGRPMVNIAINIVELQSRMRVPKPIETQRDVVFDAALDIVIR